LGLGRFAGTIAGSAEESFVQIPKRNARLRLA
jgi:hypothetical protein